MLTADEALEPTVSTRSKPGGVLRGGSTLRGGRRPASSSWRRAKGFRMGILAEDGASDWEVVGLVDVV